MAKMITWFREWFVRIAKSLAASWLMVALSRLSITNVFKNPQRDPACPAVRFCLSAERTACSPCPDAKDD
jgi:hypothetical protein